VYRWEVCAAVAQQRVVGIVRAGDPDTALTRARALVDAGLRVVEVSLTTPGALDVIGTLTGDAAPDVVVGAGTVLDPAGVRLAVLAGARFVVSPALATDVVAAAHRLGAAAVPGAGTASEVVGALEAGADLVKLFPASTWGPDALADLRQALPQAPLVPTGGVRAEDAAGYVRAGAVAVGMGSALVEGGPDAARQRVQRLLADLAAAGQ
jgi:2-dehydro-3-deoxyphosphogluconate aldolase/(4S)-4-hydroxy-2-oxoglutarate aldolase